MNIIDLSHSIDANIPTWDGSSGFVLENILDYEDCTTATQFCVQRFSCFNGIGTHMDAPAHCIPGALTIDQISIQDLIRPSVVIDVSHKADESYRCTVADLEHFESLYGMIEKRSIVAFYTGWDRYWHDVKAYRNEGVFPSISQEAAHFLVQRQIVGVIIDTLGVDKADDGFPVHYLLLKAGLFIVENATQLNSLPSKGAHIGVFSMKIKGATESPIRLIGMHS